MTIEDMLIKKFKENYPGIEIGHKNAYFDGVLLKVSADIEKRILISEYLIEELETMYKFHKDFLEKTNRKYKEVKVRDYYHVVIEKPILNDEIAIKQYHETGEEVKNKRRFRKLYENKKGKYVNVEKERIYVNDLINEKEENRNA